MRQKIDNINITARSPAHLYVLPAVESGPGALLILVCPAQVNLYSSGFLVLGTLQTGLGLHVVREGQMVEDLIELGLGNVGGQPARDLLKNVDPLDIKHGWRGIKLETISFCWASLLYDQQSID